MKEGGRQVYKMEGEREEEERGGKEEVENWRENVRKGRRGDEGNRERKETRMEDVKEKGMRPVKCSQCESDQLVL